jgi:hypothetical protein
MGILLIRRQVTVVPGAFQAFAPVLVGPQRSEKAIFPDESRIMPRIMSSSTSSMIRMLCYIL